AGGITYTNFEMFSLYLGRGADNFEIQSTHLGDTLVDGGAGNDSIHVRTVLGHTSVLGNSGDDTIELGNGAGALTIDQLRALVTVDGGTGSDTVTVDDRADTNNNVGTLDTTTISGLDLIEARVRILQIQDAPAGSFTVTIDGRTTSVL